MKKFTICGISLCTLLAATSANAAGYTCEELVEYTSCNPGYYLQGSLVCPEGFHEAENICDFGSGNIGVGTIECDDEYYAKGCVNESETSVVELQLLTGLCEPCPDGYACAGGTAQPTIVPCEAGYYLSYCPEGYSDYYYCLIDGEYFDEYEESCVDSGGKYVHVCESDEAEEYVEVRPMCNECPIGSICAGGLNLRPTVCPAGSYCATTGLAEPTGKCNVGTYSRGGATSASCTACPASDLTDANGNVVYGTTESTGATSSSECYVAKGTLFKDDKGIYKYTDVCEYGNFSKISELVVNNVEDCVALGLIHVPDEDACYFPSSLMPQTESACVAQGMYWVQEYDGIDYGEYFCQPTEVDDPENVTYHDTYYIEYGVPGMGLQ